MAALPLMVWPPTAHSSLQFMRAGSRQLSGVHGQFLSAFCLFLGFFVPFTRNPKLEYQHDNPAGNGNYQPAYYCHP